MKASIAMVSPDVGGNRVTQELAELVSKAMQICGIATLTAQPTRAGYREGLTRTYEPFEVDVPDSMAHLREEAVKCLSDLISLFGIGRITLTPDDDGDNTNLVILWTNVVESYTVQEAATYSATEEKTTTTEDKDEERS